MYLFAFKQAVFSLLRGTSLVFDTLRDDSIVELLPYHTLNHRSLIRMVSTANNTHTCLYVSRRFLNIKAIFRVSRGCGLGTRLR